MADFFEAKWYVSVDDVVATFRMYYEQVSGGETPTSAQSAGVAIQAAQLTALRDLLGTGARVESLYTRKVTGEPIPAWMGNFQDATGTDGVDALASQQALLINLRNTDGFLKRSGRVFIPGISENAITGGATTDIPYIAKIQTYLETLIDVPAGGTDNWAGELRVQRNQIDGVPTEVPVWVNVDAVDFTDVLGTQHRRKGQLRGYKPAPI